MVLTAAATAPAHGTWIVSFLASRPFGGRSRPWNAGDFKDRVDAIRHFTPLQGGDPAPGGPESGIVFDPGPGAGAGTLARARPLDAATEATALIRELLDLLNIQIRCLENGVAVRGSVVTGGLHVGPERDGPYFGPALSRARTLARNRVLPSRITVQDGIIGRLRADASLWTGDHDLRTELDLFDRMAARDETGLHYIDYLGAGFGDSDRDSARYTDVLRRHKRFVEAGLSGLSGSAAGPYGWLKSYHNACIDRDISRSVWSHDRQERHRAMVRTLTPLRIA